jgi:hypothetical protein
MGKPHFRMQVAYPNGEVWTPEYLDRYRDDVDAGRIPARTQITDGLVMGLLAKFEVSKTTFYVHYFVGSTRIQQVIGEYPDDGTRAEKAQAIQEARQLATDIKKLGDMGVNFQDGLLPRARREVLEHGTNWRPDGWVFQPKGKHTK